MRKAFTLSQKGKPKIIAGIPAYNVQTFIGNVVSGARKHVDEVVVVDDGSTDKTEPVAKAAGAQVVKHNSNQGAGWATKSCFEAAKSKDADVLITLDGDGQHDPEEIPVLVAPILEGNADLVIGSRFLNKQCAIPRYRRFGIVVITSLYNFASRVKVSDAQSCYRAYSKEALDTLNITEKGFGFSVQLLIQARRRGLIITEVPISCVYHEGSHSLNPVIHGLGVAFSVVKLRLIDRSSRLEKNKKTLSAGGHVGKHQIEKEPRH